MDATNMEAYPLLRIVQSLINQANMALFGLLITTRLWQVWTRISFKMRKVAGQEKRHKRAVIDACDIIVVSTQCHLFQHTSLHCG